MTNFKVITPAYNCEKEIEQTIISVVGQSYKNWSMVILDDLSTDSTYETCVNLAKKFGVENKIEVVKRKEKHGEVRNTLVEVERLRDEDVVIRLDAGDWLTDLGAFQILDSVYSQYDPAVAWSGHRWSFTNTNISGPIDLEKSIYDQPWRTSHLKTFRVRDFMVLNPKNFMDTEGNYIMIACDQAVFLPMIERARRRKRPLIFIPHLMYHYNIDLDRKDLFHNDRSYAQKHSAEWIRERGYIE